MSDWEDSDDESGNFNEDYLRQQPSPVLDWACIDDPSENENFGMIDARQEWTDVHKARKPGRAPGVGRRTFHRNNDSGETIGGLTRNLTFYVEKPSIGAIIGMFRLVQPR